ncbi:MAG TPA: DEAD/DEAH box helicase [Pseudonocardiaceae bacterium]|nr:DEAD/DEAH box helicase [Pseudonocardiaceae bacterium]
MSGVDVLELFSPATREWFRGAFAAPTAAQEGAWRAAAAGEHALVVAPTGSGKTLAAFLWALDRLAISGAGAQSSQRCRVLYISPLKALAVDVERNLRSPLAGIRQAAHRLNLPQPDISVGMRTGDTPAEQRRAFARTPTDVLVTTPESLFLLLTSAARESLRGVRTVIVDEVHAVAATKRGAHLALSLERLDAMLDTPAQRIGLSATVRPVEEVSAFLAGGRPVYVVQPESTKTIEVAVQVPVADMATLGELTEGADGAIEQRASIWPAVERRVLDLVGSHRSTIVFANSRRLAERLTARLNELAIETPAAPRDRMPAELMGQAGLAGGASSVIAKAHHGSMSREQRTLVEEDLKSGRLRCVVATSSLELGIDMGAVDLVVQVEAPPTVASGLQRIGRGGHQVGAVSRGVIFPKFRGDLVSCAVVAQRMADGLIEALRYPRNPLDVLAQQVVAMVALDTWRVDDLARLVRRAASYSALPDSALHAVLDMLAGRYPSEEFGELRPRIIWDRVSDELRGRPGAQRLAVTSGGTIPDRGLFTVMTPGGTDGAGSRVGELDEEMVYESRVGDTFLLGSTSWKIVDITHDRVIAAPVPGEPARMPFWKGDAPGRPLELGRALGAFVRELSATEADAARSRIEGIGLDAWAADNLLAYLREQRETAGHVPDDRTVVVERFRDELGDWRMVVHSPFGAQVNGPWALAIGARLRERRGVEAQVASADDGIVVRLPDALDADGAEVLPTAEDVLFEPDEVDQIVIAELGGSALFAARFRECAARSLLLPRRDPKRRTPLWQQRQRSAQLLAVASKYEQFPVVLEAMRECVQDVYDLPGLRELMSDVRARRIRVVEVATRSPSPFARSLLFGYVGMFLYELDAPLAERRAAALALDSTLLAELLGSEAIRELLDPEVLLEIEAQLQRLDRDRQARDLEGTADLLRTLGDLTESEAARRGATPDWLAELGAARRAIMVRIAGEHRWIAIEDAGRVRDALGAALPVGVPEAFTEPVTDPLGDLLLRYARTHGPFSAAAAATRLGLGVAVVAAALDRMTALGALVRGELRPVELCPSEHRGAPEYCHAEVLRRVRRASLARLRAEAEPVEQAALGRFLPAWHGIGCWEASSTEPARRLRNAPTPEDVVGIVEQLAGAPMPASALESLVLPARLAGYSPALLDELTISGEVSWIGCGSLPGGDGWIALAPTDLADLVLPDPDEQPPLTPIHRAVLRALGWDPAGPAAGGALFFRQLADRAGQYLLADGEPAPGDAEMVAAVWDLVWAGLLTNDSLAPVRALVAGRSPAHRPRRSAPRGRYARMRAARPPMPHRAGPPTAAGRWSLSPMLPPTMSPPASPPAMPLRAPSSAVSPPVSSSGASQPSMPPADQTRRAHARAETFLERHGVLTRGALDTERVAGGFAGIYKVLRAMEESGRCRRGYVVEGLGAAQFAIPGAIDRLRAVGQPGEGRMATVVLAATDPAQPYGAALPWPPTVGDVRHRPGRKAGALAVLVDGAAVLYIERGGRSMLSFTEDTETLRAAVGALAGAVAQGWLGSLSIERADGESALGSALAEVLRDAGFRATPRGLRLRA